MKIPQHIKDQVEELDYNNFHKIKDSEFRPHFDLSGLKYLRAKAVNERNMRELYRGRAPYELLQNADDVGATKAAFILTDDGLAFVHNGTWFTVDNFRSLADGWSDKDPKECIGHKGIGFRSVLDITPSPYLIKVDNQNFFAAKFTWALNNGHIDKTLKDIPSLRERYEKWTRHGQRVCPVMAIPGFARKHTLGTGARLLNALNRGIYGENYTTMFWFPANDPDTPRRALDDISPRPLTSDAYGINTLLDFIRYEVRVLIPFLNSISEVIVWEDRQCIASTQAIGQPTTSSNAEEISIRTKVKKRTQITTFFQMRFSSRIPGHIKRKPDTPRAVKALEEAKIVLSVVLDNGTPSHNDDARFHVYFPTEEKTGVGFIVHGDFYVKPDRTRLMTGAYNE